MECVIKGRQEALVIVAGSFDTAADGTVAATTVRRGKGWTVSRIGAGNYRITLTSDASGRKYPRIIAILPSLVIGADDWKIKPIAFSVANGTVDLETVLLATATDLPSGEIHFAIVCQNTAAGTI